MPNYFYFDQTGTKQGPVNDQQLQALAIQGTINPQTHLETDTGHRGQAGQIPGLNFNTAAPSPFASPQSCGSSQLVIHRASAYYGCAVGYDILVNGQNVGKVTNGKVIEVSVPAGFAKLEAKSMGARIIAPATINCTAGQTKKIVLRLKKNYQLKSILLTLIGIVPGLIYQLTVPPYDLEEQI